MSEHDFLFYIFVATAVTSIINCIEIIYLIRSSRRTNEILENPAPLFVGLMEALATDKEFQQEFGNFVAWAGQTAVLGIKQSMTKEGKKVPKIRSFSDLLGFVSSLPQVQSAIEAKAAGLIGPTEEVLKEVV